MSFYADLIFDSGAGTNRSAMMPPTLHEFGNGKEDAFEDKVDGGSLVLASDWIHMVGGAHLHNPRPASSSLKPPATGHAL